MLIPYVNLCYNIALGTFNIFIRDHISLKIGREISSLLNLIQFQHSEIDLGELVGATIGMNPLNVLLIPLHK